MVRFGVIGTNFITDNVLAGAKLDPHFSLKAIYSRTREKAEEFANKYNVENIFLSLEEMANSDLIDAVYIASPNSCHYEQTMLFLNRGKHVLCEKAFASNANQAREMIALSQSKGLTLMEAMKPTLTPNFKKIMELMPQIGSVTKYSSSYCQYSSRYDKYKAGIIENAFKYELSNGATVDIGVYAIYPMILLFGKPNSIHAVGSLLSTGVDSSASVIFSYDKLDATVTYSKISDGTLPTQIIGEEGLIHANRINIISDIEYIPRDKSSSSEKYSLNIKNEYFYEIEEFINLVETGKIESSINRHATSIIVMEVMDEIRKQLGVKVI